MRVLIAILVVASALSYELNKDVELAQLNKALSEFSDTETGKLILELAQFHSEMHGPLGTEYDLLATIQQLCDELAKDLQRLDTDYQKRTNNHNRDVAAFERLIQTAQFDLSVSVDQIDNFILPNIDNYNNRIDQVTRNINENRSNQQKENLNRNNDHQSFLDRVNQHQTAINGIDEAIQLMRGLLNGNVAFTEKATINHAMNIIAQRLEHNSEYSPMIEALMQLVQNFSDQSTVKQVIDLLQNMRNQLVNSLNDQTASEAERKSQFEARIKQLQDEATEFQKQINQLTYYVVAFKNKLAREQDTQALKKQDLDTLQEQLNDENASFADDTSLYQQQRSQCLTELTTARKALEFLQSAQFSNLLKQRMNQGPLAGR